MRSGAVIERFLPFVAASSDMCRIMLGIRTRTAEGRSRAQKRGQHMGRPPKLKPAQKAEARRRRAQGATLAELARSCGVEKSTISRITE
jgi:DNA invertase Pin-like site-specific DNA recombinase